MQKTIQVIILAAGRSSRFNTEETKLCFTLCGKPMVRHVADLFHASSVPLICVIGHQRERVEAALASCSPSIVFVEQQEQRGTGHAVRCTMNSWQGDDLLIMNGDMPLVRYDTIERLIDLHHSKGAAVSFVTAYHADPAQSSYGRVLFDQAGSPYKIIEARDFKGDIHAPCVINAGIYLIKRSFITEALDKLQPHGQREELYITDLIEYGVSQRQQIVTVDAPLDTVRGVNTLKELWIADHIKNSELIEYWMQRGVRFIAPQSVILHHDLTIGPDTIIGPSCQISGRTVIGSGAVLGAGVCLDQVELGNRVRVDPYALITRSKIDDGATIRAHSVVEDTHCGPSSIIGPFAHLHRAVKIGEGSQIGNFVEITRTSVGSATKIKHLSYCGDARIGNKVNIGAGTITCNWDGSEKHLTQISDGAFIGSNSALIAPVTVGAHAMTAAGSVITENVPDDALAIARSRQVTKLSYRLAKALKTGQQQESVEGT